MSWGMRDKKKVAAKLPCEEDILGTKANTFLVVAYQRSHLFASLQFSSTQNSKLLKNKQ